MKVILFENIEKLGNQGDLVEVKPGFARNYLIPQGLAQLATEKAMRLLEDHKKKMRKKEIKLVSEAKVVAEQLEKEEIVVLKKVGPEGKLYGSVTTAELAEKLQEKDYNVEKKQIHIEEPIKTTGVFTITVKLYTEVEVDVKLWVNEDESE